MASRQRFSRHEAATSQQITAHLRLHPRLASYFDQDAQQAERFFIAAVVVLLARLENRTKLELLIDSQVSTVDYDPQAPFESLLDIARTSRESFISTATAIDASIESAFPGEPVKALPAFRIFRENAFDAPAWTITVTTASLISEGEERLLTYLQTILSSALLDTQQPVGILPLLPPDEAITLYDALNATEHPYPQTPVDHLVSQQAAIDLSAPAVIFADTRVSYEELEARSNALASVFGSMGASQGRPVVLAIPRSEWMPLVELAALKAGTFFVPLDPTHPRRRLIDIIEECHPAVIVVTSATRSVFSDSGLPLLVLDGDFQLPPIDTPPVSSHRSLDDKAYTIYTSGTTGKPKGVMVSHRALVNLIRAAQAEPGMRRGDRMLGIATIAFDISVMDMFLPIASGATLVIADDQDTRDPARLAPLLESARITCMQATPATWQMLVSSGWTGKKGLRMLSGGEMLPRDLADALIHRDEEDRGELWNSYGPTETTIYSSFIRVQDGKGPVPIGPPIANTTFYIADPAGNLQPPEFPGELYIGGDGVALGYDQREELNRTKFISDPWSHSKQQRLFRTGDAARVRPDGNLDFFGRLDSQVKLRGYRIELAEIEAVLRTHPSVQAAAVILRDDQPGEPWLVAYVVPAVSDTVDDRALRAHSALRLPVYMLPSRFVQLDSLPLSGSGKVDRRALSALPAPEETNAENRLEAPATPVEKTLLKVFREVLRSPSFSLDDNFFDHGGYSLLAVRLFARIANVMRIELPITTLFEAPTVRRLSALLQHSAPLETIVSIREGGALPPFYMVQSYLLYGMAASLVPATNPVRGVREEASHTRDGMPFEERVALYADAIQRSTPSGMLHLGGWCAAAVFTVEIARRLQAQGRTIGMLALFDAEAPGFIAAPAKGSAFLARLRAAFRFHRERLHPLGLRNRIVYLFRRISQQPLRYMEWFYMRHRGFILRLHRTAPFLPNIIFYNRWTQIAPVDQPALAPINARIYLFRATDVVDIPDADPSLGWRRIANAGVEVILVPGDHETMFQEPQLSTLRHEFLRAIRTAEADLHIPSQID